MIEKESTKKIYFQCYKCRAKYSASIDHAGKPATCKKCRSKFSIPRPQLHYSKRGSAQVTFGAQQGNDFDNFFQKKPKSLGSTIVLIIGIFGLLLSIFQISSGKSSVDPLAGIFIILGALAYKSIQKRNLNPAENSLIRKAFEISSLLLVLILLLFQNPYRELLQRDPFTNFIIPLVIFIACGIIFFKNNKNKAFTFIISGFIVIIASRIYVDEQISIINNNSNQKASIQNLRNTVPIISKGNICQIKIPKYWKALENINKNAAIQVGNLQKEEYLIILPDYKKDFPGSLEDHSKLTSDNILESVENGSKRYIKTLTINGHKAIIYKISGTANRKKIAYLHTTLEGDKAFYQVIACSRNSKAKESNERFLSVLRTFREL